MENVVRIEDIPEFVERTISAVRDGIALVRKTGVLAELPKEIQFDMTVIGAWQSADLELVSTDTSTGSDNGSSVTEQNGTGTSTSEDAGTSTSEDAGTSTSEDTGTSTSEDTGTSTGTSTEKTTSTGTDASTSAGQNASYTYTR